MFTTWSPCVQPWDQVQIDSIVVYYLELVPAVLERVQVFSPDVYYLEPVCTVLGPGTCSINRFSLPGALMQSEEQGKTGLPLFNLIIEIKFQILSIQWIEESFLRITSFQRYSYFFFK